MHEAPFESGRFAPSDSGAADVRIILIAAIAVCLMGGAASARDDDDREKFCTGTAE
jgi:hypothetical protein